MVDIKYLFGFMFGFGAFFAPIQSLIICAVVFIGINFLIGAFASYKRSVRQQKRWHFDGKKGGETIYKLLFVIIGIGLSYLIDIVILPNMTIKLANIFTGFVCSVELYTYLEKSAEISRHPIFKWLAKFMEKKIEDEGIDIEEAKNKGAKK